MSACPCGNAADYAQCCGRLIEQGVRAGDCETLMRSRYTAFVRRDCHYLRNSWHPNTRPDLQAADLDGTEWLGLTVVRSKTGFKKGYVEFIARFRDAAGAEQQLHEISRFTQHNKRWVYQDDVEVWPGD
ncbi:YchJ family metal-binding protein [bacterium]|nr:YchJ family metal-binding protein [bacterium]